MSKPISSREWRTVLALTTLILLVAAIPYVIAYAVPSDHVFAGALFNPMDGQSYLAKMREGWRGDWLFTLPYTADPGPGVFLFTYYLALGHLSWLLGLPLDWVYQLARVVASTFLLLSAYHFFARFFETARARLAVWLLFALGSGLGWLAVLFGAFTSDLWVAEAYPFLSVYSNSHFCLAAGLMLWIFEWTLSEDPAALSTPRLAAAALAVTALALVQPMTLPVVGLVVGVATLWVGGRQSRQAHWPLRQLLSWPGWRPVLVVGVCAGPWVVYDLAVTMTLPQLAGWNAQNVTLSPPAWDALLSGGAPLALACVGVAAFCAPRSGADLRRQQPQMGLAILWLGLNIILLYLPLALQRRLSLGIWTPIVILAGLGWQRVVWPRLAPRIRGLAVAGLVVLAVPSNLLVYAATLGAVSVRAPALFLTPPEAAALSWLAAQPPGKVVLAGPTFSLFVPSHSEARVVYGHPMETVMADAHLQAVQDYFAGRLSLAEFEARYPVDYVAYTAEAPRALPTPEPVLPGWHKVFEQSGVLIYGR